MQRTRLQRLHSAAKLTWLPSEHACLRSWTLGTLAQCKWPFACQVESASLAGESHETCSTAPGSLVLLCARTFDEGSSAVQGKSCTPPTSRVLQTTSTSLPALAYEACIELLMQCVKSCK